MPINFIKQRKKQKYLTIIVMAVFIITAVILWFGYFRKTEPVSEIIPSLNVASEIEINFEVFEKGLCEGVISICKQYADKEKCEDQDECHWFIFLEEAQIFEEIPSFEGETGRDNPFLPY